MKMPNKIRITARRTTCFYHSPRDCPRASREENEYTSETPVMNRKKGKTKSVGVHPFHFAWLSGQ